MSEARVEAGSPSFFERYARGEATAEQIDDFVGYWHEGRDCRAGTLPLHECLGLSQDEYEVWVYDPDALPHILTSRREQRPLETVMAERLDQLLLAARETDKTIIRGLRIWLSHRQER